MCELRPVLVLFVLASPIFLSHYTSDATEFKSYKLRRLHRHNHRMKSNNAISEKIFGNTDNSEENFVSAGDSEESFGSAGDSEESFGSAGDLEKSFGGTGGSKISFVPAGDSKDNFSDVTQNHNASNFELELKLNETDARNNGTNSTSEVKSRKRRSTFAWPPDSLFITQFSLEVPLYSPEGVGIPLLLEVPYEFELPNVTKGARRRKRSTEERFSFYRTIESLFGRFGYDGRSCMLRAVCERSESDVMSEGLLGEVLNLLLAVSTAGTDSELLWEYNVAEHHGNSEGDCSEKYKSCPISIFQYFDD